VVISVKTLAFANAINLVIFDGVEQILPERVNRQRLADLVDRLHLLLPRAQMLVLNFCNDLISVNARATYNQVERDERRMGQRAAMLSTRIYVRFEPEKQSLLLNICAAT